MSEYIIKGGKKLEGVVEISGSKNASLPIIAATILNGGITTLYNVPNIHDTLMMFEILKELGGKVQRKKNKYIIDTRGINKFTIPDELMREMRSSVIFVGALIGKHKKATFSYPGGCDIGARPIDMHLKNFQKLEINISKNYGNISCFCDRISGGKIELDFPSVGTTENVMLASCLAEGKTIISNAAMEPEIVDLQKFLNRMGAKIKGAGTNTIQIEGVKKLKDISYTIMPDRIETGTFLCACGITNGNIKLENTNSEHISPIISKLEEAGCNFKIDKTSIQINAPRRLKSVDIQTMPYPGFPTDMQSVFTSMQTISKGTSMTVENIFENRYKYIQELIKMNAKVSIKDKVAIVKGVRRLYSAEVKATDLRGGAALVLAGLAAKGKTVIKEVGYIQRGYDDFDGKLRRLGAQIEFKD